MAAQGLHTETWCPLNRTSPGVNTFIGARLTVWYFLPPLCSKQWDLCYSHAGYFMTNSCVVVLSSKQILDLFSHYFLFNIVVVPAAEFVDHMISYSHCLPLALLPSSC